MWPHSSMSPVTPSPRKRISEMNCEELRSECRKLRRKVSGTKYELVKRLEDTFQRNDRGCNWRHGAVANDFSYLAQGEHRKVYKGEYTKGPRKGNAAVSKVFKTGSVFENSFFEQDILAVDKAAEIIKAFNAYGDTLARPMQRFYINKPEVWIDVDPPHAKSLVEPFIQGVYKKFNSNTGWVSDSSLLTEALTHFSYHFTRGKYLLCDLQGSMDRDHFLLTDPVIHSLTDEYGATDGGKAGMDAFFSRHRCNSYCSASWGRSAPLGSATLLPARSGTSFFLQRR